MTRGTLVAAGMPDGARVETYRVSAGSTSRRGTLLLLQEIFGLTDHIRELCDGYADEGYDVIAPALFDREAPGLQATYSADDVQRCIAIARETHDFATTVSDISHLVEAAQFSGAPVFIVGYCYGGSAAWASACRCDGIAAVSSYYGSLVPRFSEEKPRAPVICHFGERDASIPREDIEAVRRRHPYLPIHLYPAGHGFNSDRRTDFDEASAHLARRRTLAFFDACA